MKQPLSIHHITLRPAVNAGWCYWKDIEIYFSNTRITPDVPQASWGTPVVKMQYPGPRGSDFIINFSDSPSTQYVVIVFLTSLTNSYINIMEFEVYGY
jgi:hypothetical protein